MSNVPEFSTRAETSSTENPFGPPTVYVDLDGTLAKHDPTPGAVYIHNVIGAPIHATIDRVKRYLIHGIPVKIFTARLNGDANHDAEVVSAIDRFTVEHFGQTVPVTNVKGPDAVLFIDDRAISAPHNKGIAPLEIPFGTLFAPVSVFVAADAAGIIRIPRKPDLDSPYLPKIAGKISPLLYVDESINHATCDPVFQQAIPISIRVSARPTRVFIGGALFAKRVPGGDWVICISGHSLSDSDYPVIAPAEADSKTIARMASEYVRKLTDSLMEPYTEVFNA